MTSDQGRSRRTLSPHEVREQERAKAWKQRTTHLPDTARAPGYVFGNRSALTLPLDHEPYNLWEPIRAPLLALFDREAIAWQAEDDPTYAGPRSRGPAPHLLSSQAACLNFWFGLALTPTALEAVLRPYLPRFARLIPPVDGGPLLQPEWIGEKNHLRELVRRGTVRRRGTRTTSADLLLAYLDEDGARHGVLVESKYTEHCLDAKFQLVSRNGTDRVALYERACRLVGSPLREELGLQVNDFLIDPFDQHLREQLLAAGMAEAAELRFQSVMVLHVAPRANRAYHEEITAPALRSFGATVAEAWNAILKDRTRYLSVAYEDLFAAVTASNVPPVQPWVEYQRERYHWA